MSIQWIHDSTHYDQSCDIFYKVIDGMWYMFFDDGGSAESSSLYNGETDENDLIARHSSKPWSGPEDGLPPVGTVCEQQTWVNRLWRKVQVVAHFNKFAVCAWEESPGDSQVELAPPYDLRLPTDEIDQRETAIRELMDIAQVDCRVTAALLVDAGFKRDHMKF